MPDAPTEEEEKRNKGKDDWKWVEEDVKMTRLHVVTAQKNAGGRRETRVLTPASLNVWVSGGFDWSADSKSVAFTHTKSPSWNDWVTSDISVVDVQSGNLRAFITGDAAASQPRYSPDGSHVAFTLSDDPPHWAGYSQVHVAPAEGGEPRPLASTFDGSPNLLGWSQDGTQVYCVEPRGTRQAVYALALDAQGADIQKGIQALDLGDSLIAEITLNATRTHLGFSRQSSTQAVEAFVAPLAPDTTLAGTQISQTNGEFAAMPIGETEILRWRSRDGLEIEGLLTYPVGYKMGQRVPLLLVIHGGPSGVFLQSFLGAPSIYPLATFTARGYAILRVNPRGSSGYGKDFRYANLNDWGGGDYEDLMTGVDRVIDKGVADPERMGVMGWSYGGFMTSWIITHTDRFKCASVGAAVTNLMSFTGTADIPGFLPDYFGGQFWDDLEPYRLHSPMFHVKGACTPSLIQHGDADLRVPISQGYELYNALKAQGVPVRMLVLPRQPHGPSEPKMQLKTLQTNADWFDEYLKAK